MAIFSFRGSNSQNVEKKWGSSWRSSCVNCETYNKVSGNPPTWTPSLRRCSIHSQGRFVQWAAAACNSDIPAHWECGSAWCSCAGWISPEANTVFKVFANYLMIQNDDHLKRNLVSASRSRRVGMRFGWSVPTAIQIGDIVKLSWALGSAVNFNSVLVQFTLQKAYILKSPSPCNWVV